ncbi:MAG: helix-turn-helix domain-containing protein [Nitrososphaeraceae archaeon]
MSFYRYWKRYTKDGLGLKDRSKIPHTIHRTEKRIQQKIVQLREKYHYCPHKIQGTLANQYNIKIGHMTDYRILCKRGLNINPVIKPRKKRKYI